MLYVVDVVYAYQLKFLLRPLSVLVLSVLNGNDNARIEFEIDAKLIERDGNVFCPGSVHVVGDAGVKIVDVQRRFVVVAYGAT